jgi:hypothetical protein
MRKALLAVLAAAAIFASTASADTAQGKLTGNANLAGVPFAIGNPVLDGGTDPLYIGKENDKSGNCEEDSGTITLGVPPVTVPVVCAHFVASSKCCNGGSPKMRFAFGDFVCCANQYWVARITDNGFGTVDTYGQVVSVKGLANAMAWVNKGAQGSGNMFSAWTFLAVAQGGDFSVQAQQ